MEQQCLLMASSSICLSGSPLLGPELGICEVGLVFPNLLNNLLFVLKNVVFLNPSV